MQNIQENVNDIIRKLIVHQDLRSSNAFQEVIIDLENLKESIQKSDLIMLERVEDFNIHYEQRFNHAKQVIFELETEIETLKKERAPFACNGSPDKILSQEGVYPLSSRSNKLFIKSPLLSPENPLFCPFRFENLIQKEVNQRVHEANQVSCFEDEANKCEIKELERKLEEKTDENNIILELNLMKKRRNQVEELKLQVKSCEARVKQLAEEKSEMTDELKHAIGTRTSLFQQIEKLSQENCLQAHTIASLEEKLENHKNFQNTFEANADELQEKLKFLEGENAKLACNLAQSIEDYEAKIRLLRDSEKISQNIKKSMSQRPHVRFSSVDEKELKTVKIEDTPNRSCCTTKGSDSNKESNNLSEICKFSTCDYGALETLSDEKIKDGENCLRDELRDLPTISQFENIVSEFSWKHTNSGAKVLCDSTNIKSPTAFKIPQSSQKSSYYNSYQNNLLPVHQKGAFNKENIQPLNLQDQEVKTLLSGVKKNKGGNVNNEVKLNDIEVKGSLEKETALAESQDLSADLLDEISYSKSEAHVKNKKNRALKRANGCISCNLI